MFGYILIDDYCAPSEGDNNQISAVRLGKLNSLAFSQAHGFGYFDGWVFPIVNRGNLTGLIGFKIEYVQLYNLLKKVLSKSILSLAL